MRIEGALAKWSIAAAAIVIAAGGSLAQQTQTQTPTQTPPPGGRQGGPGGGRQANPFPRPPTLPFPDGAQVVETTGAPVRVVPLFKGLASPWSLAFLPNGDMLITEKPGRLRIVRGGTLDPQPVAGTPQVFAVGQGGSWKSRFTRSSRRTTSSI